MSVSVTMPRLGESVTEGTVTRWLKKEGERIEVDEPLLEVSTDKVDTEIPSPASGVIQSIKVAEDETVEVGAELAVIEEVGAGATKPASPSPSQTPAVAEPNGQPAPPSAGPPARPPAGTLAEQAVGQPQAESAAPPPQRESLATEPDATQLAPADGAERGADDGGDNGGTSDGPAYVTPLVRKLAAEHGVDLAAVRGTGVGGRIRKQDVISAAGNGGAPAPSPVTTPAGQPAQQPPPAPTPALTPAPAPASAAAERAAGLRGTTQKLSRLRHIIATRMVESLQTSAQLTTVVEADVTRIARLRAQTRDSFEARESLKLSFLPFFALATCEALRQHPTVNSSVDLAAGTVTYHDAVHLGIAVDTERGLLVPVIHGAQDLNLAGLARKIADLAVRTRSNAITPDELGGGTFTLTNTGSRGALFDTPILNQPQVGILGTGSVVRRPAVVDDPELGEVVAIRHIVYLALTYDHRIVDGSDAARFLTTVQHRLQEGAFEAELGLA